MDFSAQLEKLQQQANETVASIRSASAESLDELCAPTGPGSG